MELTLKQALQKGIEAHKAGRAQEADRYYTAILKANNNHPDANHNMGVLAVNLGKVEAALPFLKKALEVGPNIAQFWLTYIDVLLKLDRIYDAKEVFDQAKSNGMRGDSFDTLAQQLGWLKEDSAVGATSGNFNEPPENQLHRLINLYTQGKYQETQSKASTLLTQYPNSINLYNILGTANKGLGKLDEAIEAYNKALSIKPDYADAYNNMGITLYDQGKLDEAIEAYNKALSIKPDYADAYNNMGISLHWQGKLDEAIGAYEKVISINPDYTDAYNNMGNSLQKRGKLQEAIEAYKKALFVRPDNADAYYNMGIALQGQGNLEKAIEAYNKAIFIRPDFFDAQNNICVILTSITFNKPDKSLQKTITSILEKKTFVRPITISKAAISLLKLDPTLKKHLQLDCAEVIKCPSDVISDLSKLPLLLKLMSVCPLPDLEVEKLLQNLRCAILLNISSLEQVSPGSIAVQSALALQCFTNEYIYNDTEEEKKALRALEKKVKATFKNNEQPNSQWLLSLASYKALNQYDWCDFLVITQDIQEVFTRQVSEPNHEEKIKNQLPILEEITDSASSEVRAQYEESPYPRWVNLGLPIKPGSISMLVDQIKLKLHDKKITEVKKPEILYAGCGTGQHSIETRKRFESSNVLAIDLSQSSLAYAKRKTEELGILGINYMQADILDLDQLNKQFDIIESAGVLHHMDNPMAGWKILTDCLKPGGLMSIGLYSELARRHIVKIRKEISQTGIGSSKREMRSFRDIVINSDKDHHKLITIASDFYSLSTLKDLLFHILEQRFTIPKIKDHLDKLDLRFCGFESSDVVAHFRQSNTYKEDVYDLDKWHAYEQANPDAFVGMYQFWCQKVE